MYAYSHYYIGILYNIVNWMLLKGNTAFLARLLNQLEGIFSLLYVFIEFQWTISDQFLTEIRM